MPHPYLPKLKSGTENAVAVPAQEGVWNDEQAKTRLDNLAKAIETPPALHRIYSIPDPWARAILFDRALFDDAHNLHRAILNEWRGLLAIIGLKQRRHFDGLSIRPVSLKASDLRSSFGRVVSQLMPIDTELIDSATGWETFYVFRWMRQPHEHNRPRAFAFTSPMTIVATGAEYKDLLGTDEVPWFDGTVLKDPTEHLAARERKALAEWIHFVMSQISAFSTSVRRGRLIERFRDFANDLDRTAQLRNEEEVADKRATLGLTHGIFRILDKPRKAEAEALTDVEINTNKPGAPTLYLIDPSLAQQWNVPDREITINQDVNLATSRQYTHTGMNYGSVTPNISWCTANYFFADRLIYEKNDADAFPGCRPVKTSGNARSRFVAVPLNPDTTKLFTPAYLADKFSIEWLPDGGATCRLELHLRSMRLAQSGKGGSGSQTNGRQDGPTFSSAHQETTNRECVQERPCTIQRTYREDEMVRVDSMPPVAIWPNFKLRGVNWKTYFLFQSWGESEKREFSVKPGDPDETTSREHNLEGTRFEIYRVSSFPEVLVCEAPYHSSERNRTLAARGLLLVNPPPDRKPPSAGSVALGVDFG